MQPFEYVILLFSICLLYALLRVRKDTVQELVKAAYEAGQKNAANQVFLVNEGFGRFGVFPSPFNPDPDFVENMIKDLNKEIEIHTTVPPAAAAFFDYEESDDIEQIGDTAACTYSMEIKPPASEPGGFLFRTLGMISQSSDEERAMAAEVNMEKFTEDLEKTRLQLRVKLGGFLIKDVCP